MFQKTGTSSQEKAQINKAAKRRAKSIRFSGRKETLGITEEHVSF